MILVDLFFILLSCYVTLDPSISVPFKIQYSQPGSGLQLCATMTTPCGHEQVVLPLTQDS